MFSTKEIDYTKDVPQVVALMNKSLSSNRTFKDFLWKHCENPFGQSYGLLAVDRGEIVGVRMFMKWELRGNNNIVRAIRPVDTATDKNHRRKGIFKTLNEEGAAALKDDKHLVFNTPNKNSTPGNLKLGWESIDNSYVHKIGIPNFLSKKYNFIKLDSLSSFDKDFKNRTSNLWSTNTSGEFLKWRYSGKAYNFALFEEKDLIVYKLENLKGIKTLLLIDALGPKKNVSGYINCLCRSEKAYAVYYMENVHDKPFRSIIEIRRSEQTVLVKDDKQRIGDKISFSLGDLEGII